MGSFQGCVGVIPFLFLEHAIFRSWLGVGRNPGHCDRQPGPQNSRICAWDFGSCSRILRDLIFPLLDWTIHLLRPVAGVRYGLDLRWSYLIGWPGFCASLGAGGMIIYRWLFSRAGAAGWGAIPPPE